MLGVSLRGFSMDGRGDAPLDFSGYPLALDLPNARSMRNYTIFGNTSEDAKGVGDEVVQMASFSDGMAFLNGITITKQGGKLSFSGICTASFNYVLGEIAIISGHKYALIDGGVKYPISGRGVASLQLYFSGINLTLFEYGNASGEVGTATASGTATLRHRFDINEEYNIADSYPLIFDLTAKYGAGNEPSTADEFAHRLGYADAAHLPAFPYGSSFVAPIRVANPRAKVDLGTLTWTATPSGNGRFFALLSDIRDNTNGNVEDMSCAKYDTISAVNVYDGITGIANAQGRYLWVHDNSFGGYTSATAAAFKAAMSGVMLDYPLAVPETLATYPSVLSSPLHKIGDIVDYKESNGKEHHNTIERRLKDLTWTPRPDLGNDVFYTMVADKAAGQRNFAVGTPFSVSSAQGTAGLADKELLGNATYAFVYIKCVGCTTSEDIINAVQDTRIVYELATPTEVQGEPLPRLAIPKGESIVTLDTAVEPSNITAKV